MPEGFSPANNDSKTTDCVPSPLSLRVIGRIVIRRKRPAPLWRVTSSAGTAEPVSMNCPGSRRLSTSWRTTFQRLGASCHSSIRRGVLPLSTVCGDADARLRSPGSASRRTELVEKCRPEVVFPAARGPWSMTAPKVCSERSMRESAIRGLYSATGPEYRLCGPLITFFAIR